MIRQKLCERISMVHKNVIHCSRYIIIFNCFAILIKMRLQFITMLEGIHNFLSIQKENQFCLFYICFRFKFFLKRTSDWINQPTTFSNIACCKLAKEVKKVLLRNKFLFSDLFAFSCDERILYVLIRIDFQTFFLMLQNIDFISPKCNTSHH